MKILLTLITIGLISAGLLAFQTSNKFPNISGVTFTLTTGKRLSISQLSGKPILVTFWATSCTSCIKEIPELKRLYQTYMSQGFEIIAVAMPYDRPDHVLEFTKERNLPYPVALDIDSRIVRAFGGVDVTPNNFLIDPQGKIKHQQVGILNSAHTEKWLHSTLTDKNK